MADSIGLIAAMRLESQALLRLVRDAKRFPLGNLPAWTFSISNHPCVLVTSGMGARRAANAARRLIEQYEPRFIVSFGISGAVENDIEIGDVVLAGQFCPVNLGTPEEIRPLASWPEAAQEAVSRVMNKIGKRAMTGSVVTTGGSQFTQGQLRGLIHPVLEMETAGIAQAAAEKGIPLYSLRAISDGPRAPIPLNLTEMMDEDANLKTGRLIKALFRQPAIIVQGIRILHNSTLAAEHAAQALLAAVSHL